MLKGIKFNESVQPPEAGNLAQTQKFTLNTLIQKISPQKRKICIAIMRDFANKFETFPGSIAKHQSWTGGYRDHVEETMNISVVLYQSLGKKRKMPFSLSDALFILFIHDLDKLLSYKAIRGKYRRKLPTNSVDVPKILNQRYKYKMTQKEKNAVRYIHGENQDYHPTKRIMLPLTAFVHCCDIISSRMWHDKGKNASFW